MKNIRQPVKSSIIVFLAVLFILCYGALQSYIGPDQEIPSAMYSRPTEFVRPEPPSFKWIAQIVHDDENIFLVPNDHEGIVEIYDTSGNYRKTLSVYTTLNGATQIAVKDGIFYIRSKQGDLYLYENGVFSGFYSYTKTKELKQSIDFEASSTVYYQKNGSVWKEGENGPECVIPGALTPTQHLHYQILRVTSLVALAAVIVLLKKRRRSDG